MNTEKYCKENSFALAEETVCFGGMLLEYRLLGYATPVDRFHISIVSGKEKAEFGIGNSLDAALQIYHSVVHGRVTPCGLGDVLEDLCG